MKDKEEKIKLIELEINGEDELSSLDNSSMDSTEVYVSAIVPDTDDPSTPSFTFRVLVLGSFWNVFLATVNSIFSFRSNPLPISSTIATLLTYPMAIFMAWFLPRRYYNIFGFRFSLNPGEFSVKEHVLISIIASAGGGLAYGVDNVVVQRFNNFMGNRDINFWNSLGFVMSVQLVGFGMAGILRRFLVKPAAMYWPSILSSVALFVGFHENVIDDRTSKYKLSRYSFFWLATIVFYVYTWIPEYFFTVLQSISLLCLITSNPVARFLGSSDDYEGVGLGAISFDWYYIGGGNLTAPFWASLQLALANIMWSWIFVPIFFYANVFGGDKILQRYDDYPGYSLNTAGMFTKAGVPLSPLSLMDKTTYDLNQTAYNSVQPIYISTMFAFTYGLSFMAITSAVVHVILWYGGTITKQFKAALRRSDNEEDDIHSRLMRAYPDVPDWAFAAFLILMILLQVVVSATTPFKMPIWSVILCIAIALFFLLPIGVIYAVTGLPLGLNVLTEFVIGLMIPGQTIAVMAFKSLGTNTIIQALSLTQDLKLGHYMKINPVHMIAAQLYGTVIGAIINTGISIWAESLLSNLLFTNADWKANGFKTFYSAGAIWGAIGPKRFFGIGSPYENLLWFFLAGLLAPLFPWLGNRIYPSKLWQYINIPLLASGASSPGGLQNGVIMPLLISWLFQYYIFHNYNEWWKKYNYMLAVASDTGVALAVLSTTILTQSDLTIPAWPGNPETKIDYYCFDDMGWSK